LKPAEILEIIPVFKEGRADLGSMYAIAEMSQRAEETLLRIRSELFRIGCADKILIRRHGPFLEVAYRAQSIQAAPFEVLSILRATRSDLNDADVWDRVSKKALQARQQSQQKDGWVVGLIMSTIILLLLIVFTVNL
jgi:hypothetical protein